VSAIDLLARLRQASPSPARLPPWEDADLRRITQQVQERLRREHPALLRPSDVTAQDQRELRLRIESCLAGDPSLRIEGLPVAALAGMIFDYVAGLGPIGALLERPDVSEVMVNRFDEIWIEADGRLGRLHGLSFRDDLHVFYVAQRILAPLGIELSVARPLAEGRLPGNIRVAASIPPVSRGTTLSVRRQAMAAVTTEEYLRRGTADEAMLRFLQQVVRGRGNLLIAGPTGTGKTTLLRYLGSYFDPAARVVVLEQVAELGLEQFHPHVVSLEARAPGPESRRGGIGIEELLTHALHRRPDYIVVGAQYYQEIGAPVSPANRAGVLGVRPRPVPVRAGSGRNGKARLRKPAERTPRAAPAFLLLPHAPGGH
jgi:pilus assembly protein CpaF